MVDQGVWQPFISDNAYMDAYTDAQNAVGGEYSDNYYKRLRFWNVMQCVNMVIKADVAGDFAECGVFRGHSALMIATLLTDNNVKGRPFHLFDSFEGLSARTVKDGSRRKLKTADVEREAKFFACDEPTVRKHLSNYDFFQFYKGWIPNRFAEVEDKMFAFVYIDVDLYQPTLDSLKFFMPRMNRGGIIALDDYYHSHFTGVVEAVSEVDPQGNGFSLYEVPMGGAFLLKR